VPIEVRNLGRGIAVVSVSGDVALGGGRLGRSLDLRGRSLEDLGQSLGRLLQDGDSRIVLDLSGARFIDSAGFGALVSYKKRALERGGDVCLVVGEGRVRDLIEMIRLDRVFDLHDDVAAAVDRF